MARVRRLLCTALIAAAAAVLCVTAASAAELGVGTVNSDGLRLRAEAGTDASILTSAGAGEVVIVREDGGEGWYKVNFKGTDGYMFAEYVDLAATQDAPLGYGRVSTDGATLNVRSGPGTDYDRVAVLNSGAVVELKGLDNGWYKVSCNGSTGYALSDYITPCAGGGSGSAGAATPGSDIVAYAKQYLGKPYTWGGNGPNSFDCSGFTKYVYSHFGYSLGRTASAQLSNGVAVSRDQLRAGDLVFFYNGKVSTPVSHVGIYIGGGEFIHASTNSYTVKISSLSSSSYSKMYVYARRIV